MLEEADATTSHALTKPLACDMYALNLPVSKKILTKVFVVLNECSWVSNREPVVPVLMSLPRICALTLSGVNDTILTGPLFPLPVTARLPAPAYFVLVSIEYPVPTWLPKSLRSVLVSNVQPTGSPLAEGQM